VRDPITDLVEQFSTLMLMASAAFGVQKVLINIGSWWPLSVAVSATAMCDAVAIHSHALAVAGTGLLAGPALSGPGGHLEFRGLASALPSG
jgi:hypothetical protein